MGESGCAQQSASVAASTILIMMGLEHTVPAAVLHNEHKHLVALLTMHLPHGLQNTVDHFDSIPVRRKKNCAVKRDYREAHGYPELLFGLSQYTGG